MLNINRTTAAWTTRHSSPTLSYPSVDTTVCRVRVSPFILLFHVGCQHPRSTSNPKLPLRTTPLNTHQGERPWHLWGWGICILSLWFSGLKTRKLRLFAYIELQIVQITCVSKHWGLWFQFFIRPSLSSRIWWRHYFSRTFQLSTIPISFFYLIIFSLQSFILKDKI